jgi:hypothetical protein
MYDDMADDMADDMSCTVAIENSSISVEDCLSSLSSMQINDKPITLVKGKLKWNGSFESLLLFVEATLKIEGKWSSPGGHLKVFSEAKNKVVIRYYTNTSSLIIQGDKGKELMDGLVDKLESNFQPNESELLADGDVTSCELSAENLSGGLNSTSITADLAGIISEDSQEFIVNSTDVDTNGVSAELVDPNNVDAVSDSSFAEIFDPNNVSEGNFENKYGVDNACQTQGNGEYKSRASHMCRDYPCLCQQVTLDIESLKSHISKLQSSVFSFEIILKDHDSILSMYNRAADLNEKYLKEINDSKRLITCLEQKIAKVEEERDSLQLATRLIAQDKYGRNGDVN